MQLIYLLNNIRHHHSGKKMNTNTKRGYNCIICLSLQVKPLEHSASLKHNILTERGDKLTPNLRTHSLIW